ncbi:toll-like receptor 2 [Bufo bufo]|uniref:toll-like receptor 2 n=1 Tax=Bufo bufo TaxID=8384 RepID=UPI001ABDC987|nr:toll-like receptor 2 [Bufo bufo]XP_040268347.1 toll-like receptor 2 [Bufo bufo]XP_040268348.1 toll-like receptor 2 [Bufo bufo]
MCHHIVYLVLHLISFFGVVKLCESVCDISTDEKYVYCKGEYLNYVPQNLSEKVEYLDLSFNKITELNRGSFSRYPSLNTLNLSFNNISHIDNGSFEANLLLRNLSLFNNSLEEIPASSLEHLKSLQILDLSNNFYRFSTLGKEFYKLVKLQVLSIGGPLISRVLKYDFAVIQNISLQKFALKTKSSLEYYEHGAFSVLNTEVFWLDIALDSNASMLNDMLKDLAGKNLTTLRFRNLFEFSYYEHVLDIFSFLPDINIRDLIFYRGKFNENLLRLVLKNVQSSKIKNLLLLSVDFARSVTHNTLNKTINDLVLQNLVIQDVTNPDILRFDWTFTWFSKVTYLSIINVNFNFVPCDAWGQMANVVSLNISNNRLFAAYLYNLQCQQNVLPNIETFNVSHNQIDSLRTISLLTAKWPKLTQLDLASNAIGSIIESCVWNIRIKILILRNNMLTVDVFRCLPVSLEYLDMSNSHLERLNISYFDQATNLTKLILKDNKIMFIPAGWNSPNLQVLALEGNSFGVIDQGSFQNLVQLKELTAGNNPYHCTCDLHAFITDTLKEGSLSLSDWPEKYYCYHPTYMLDTRIESFSPGRLECDVRLVVAVSVSVTAFVLIIGMLLCLKFDIPWYLRATCQIIQSKYRARNSQETREYAFHAFISYSYSDSDWVRGVLLSHLENSNPPYRVCIHERDFLPGRWIIDNIIENIENSQKIIFVLSHNFVNSEWCNYELYFAHQRAIGHSFGDVILVVKENIKMEDLPKRFCRLRKLLSTKTYLEWPLEENRQPFFWFQLKSILGKGSKSLSVLDNMSMINETIDVGVDRNSE